MLYNVDTCIAIFFHISYNPVYPPTALKPEQLLQTMFHQNP